MRISRNPSLEVYYPAMTDKKLKYAVIGDPVAHSLSPQMHNAAFKALGINAEYLAVHVK